MERKVKERLTWVLFHPTLLFKGKLFEINLNLTYGCTLTVGLHILDLN